MSSHEPALAALAVACVEQQTTLRLDLTWLTETITKQAQARGHLSSFITAHTISTTTEFYSISAAAHAALNRRSRHDLRTALDLRDCIYAPRVLPGSDEESDEYDPEESWEGWETGRKGG